MKNNIESRLDARRRSAVSTALRHAIDTYILSYVEGEPWLFGSNASIWEAWADMKPDNYPSTAADKLARQFYAAIGAVMRRNATHEAYVERQADAAKDEADLLSDKGAKTAGDFAAAEEVR